jgi:hypothetical protein
MSIETQELEDLSSIILRSNGVPVHEQASENLYQAILRGLIQLDSAEVALKHIEESALAGRVAVGSVGAVA